MFGLIVSIFIITIVMGFFLFAMFWIVYKIYKFKLKRNDKFLEEYYNYKIKTNTKSNS